MNFLSYKYMHIIMLFAKTFKERLTLFFFDCVIFFFLLSGFAASLIEFSTKPTPQVYVYFTSDNLHVFGMRRMGIVSRSIIVKFCTKNKYTHTIPSFMVSQVCMSKQHAIRRHCVTSTCIFNHYSIPHACKRV